MLVGVAWSIDSLRRTRDFSRVRSSAVEGLKDQFASKAILPLTATPRHQIDDEKCQTIAQTNKPSSRRAAKTLNPRRDLRRAIFYSSVVSTAILDLCGTAASWRLPETKPEHTQTSSNPMPKRHGIELALVCSRGISSPSSSKST